MKLAAEFDATLALTDVAPGCPANLAKQISLGLRWTPEGDALSELAFLEGAVNKTAAAKASVCGARESLLENTRQQLIAWFKDPGFRFSVPLSKPPTDFQAKLRNFLLSMPSGTTCTYSDLAGHLHSAPRAVGQALGSNNLPLIVPCHRVISAGKNRLTGFNHQSDGVMLELKAWLLAREAPSLNFNA